MNANKSLRAKLAVIVAVLALWASSIACDNGGTINPDSGCIGQGANFDNCASLIDNTLPK